MKQKQRKMVRVQWADAYAEEETGWQYLHTIPDKGEYVVDTIGWLLSVGDGGQSDHVSVAQSVGVRDDAGDHILHIPIDMVRAVWVLTPVKTTLGRLLGRLVGK